MRFLEWAKDGGPESPADGFYFIECKPLFSVVLLKFNPGVRDNYHNHAFNAWSWLIRGVLVESMVIEADTLSRFIKPSFKPFKTPRFCMHKVQSFKTAWALTFRGPWTKTWLEYNKENNKIITLTNGRKEVNTDK